jgi:hypothetical protein
MKAQNGFSRLMIQSEIQLDFSEMNSIRGGISGGKGIPIDEDILIPDPEPEN